jgi:hypothetical protein
MRIQLTYIKTYCTSVPHSNSQGYCTGRQEYAENLYLWVGVFCAARALILSDNCHLSLPYITELQMWVLDE